MNPFDYQMPDTTLEWDTHNVLVRRYHKQILRDGAYGCVSPIFDKLAAERFGR